MLTVILSDVTLPNSLEEAHHTITTTLPHPLAGVLYGAMVLRDVAVRDMSLSDINDVLQTRAWGSHHLDQLLAETPLDFFVLLSSCGGLLAFQGQAAYGASNVFLDSLAAKRRARGLAASVVDLGLVMGVGFTTREEAGDEVHGRIRVERGNLMLLGETDVHDAVAEAIVAGREKLCDGWGHEILSGVREVNHGAKTLPTWVDNPIFANLLCTPDASEEHKTSGASGAGGLLSLADRLAAAETEDDVRSAVRGKSNIIQTTSHVGSQISTFYYNSAISNLN